MFIHLGFESVNGLGDLIPGEYRGVCSVYVNRNDQSMALLSQYWSVAQGTVVAADLQVVDGKTREVSFVDFVVIPDGSWRNSYGRCADTLGAALPQEISKFVHFEEVPLGIQTVEVAGDDHG